jgi:hypothetical protein
VSEMFGMLAGYVVMLLIGVLVVLLLVAFGGFVYSKGEEARAQRECWSSGKAVLMPHDGEWRCVTPTPEVTP